MAVIRDLLEPAALEVDSRLSEALYLASIAISAKRIADILARSTGPHAFTDIAFNAGMAFEVGRSNG